MQTSCAPGPGPSTLLRALHPLCRQQHFQPGDVLRQRGHHYADMYLITQGSVCVERAVGGTTVRTCGSPIGEIGFLRGTPAIATCRAQTSTTALVIDDPILARIEREQPALVADLLRYLGEIADERASFNLLLAHGDASYVHPRAIEVHLCRDPDMLESAQRLRYEVYCGELGRQSPYADHERRTITDDLDATAWTFVAVEAGETIGTLRGNKSDESALGVIEELYGMKASPRHPAETAICTKFIVKRSKRGGPAALKLISAMVRFGLRKNVKECYIDCIPALLPYYKALGFEVAGPPFFHRENGPSHPMRIDLVKHGPRLSRDAGLRDYLSLFLKAKAISWLDRLRGHREPATTS
jgi:predicted GNAT family N-acyltransferase